jgi:hypothetical protein
MSKNARLAASGKIRANCLESQYFMQNLFNVVFIEVIGRKGGPRRKRLREEAAAGRPLSPEEKEEEMHRIWAQAGFRRTGIILQKSGEGSGAAMRYEEEEGAPGCSARR